MSRRSVLLATCLCAVGCAFPPSIRPIEPSDAGDEADGGALDGGSSCPRTCAGRCQEVFQGSGRCVAARDGARCDPAGAAPACLPGSDCVGRVCVRSEDPCTADPCQCLGFQPCAGRCELGECFPAELGEACRPTGAGVACSEGRCLEGRCQSDEVSEPVAVEKWIAKGRALYCGYLVRCGFWPATLADRCGPRFFDDARRFDSHGERVALVARGVVAYDPVEAGRCLGAFSEMACFSPLPEACARVFTGSLPAGASCSTDVACAEAFHCARADLSGLSCGGSCAPRAGAGEACDDVPCLRGLSCVSEGAARTCRARTSPAAEGRPCGNGGAPCLAGLYCRSSDHVCSRRRGLNESCDYPADCVDGLACAIEGARALCLPRRSAGQSCTSNQQCSPLHAVVSAQACLEGSCLPLPRSGPCVADEDLANACDPTAAFCGEDGQCAPHVAAEGACLRSDHCGGILGVAICSFGQCHVPLECADPP